MNDDTATNATIFADGFDDCIIGYVYDKTHSLHRIAYDQERMIETLMIRDDMSLDVAMEHLEFNTLDAYAGKGTPLYVNLCNDRKEMEDYLLTNQ